MIIPHWLIGIAIFAAIGGFIAFTFRQGQQVKPDKNKAPDEWKRYRGPPPSFGGQSGHCNFSAACPLLTRLGDAANRYSITSSTMESSPVGRRLGRAPFAG
jgi:hypothetical protein